MHGDNNRHFLANNGRTILDMDEVFGSGLDCFDKLLNDVIPVLNNNLAPTPVWKFWCNIQSLPLVCVWWWGGLDSKTKAVAGEIITNKCDIGSEKTHNFATILYSFYKAGNSYMYVHVHVASIHNFRSLEDHNSALPWPSSVL